MNGQAGMRGGGVVPSCEAVGGEMDGARVFVLRAGVLRYAPF